MTKKKDAVETILISPPRMETAVFTVTNEGLSSDYVQSKFSTRDQDLIAKEQEKGSTPTTKRKKRPPKDFNRIYEDAAHKSSDGWYGIPACSFRNAMIDACRVTGYTMSKAKMSVFVEADGVDSDDGMPLVKIVGRPRRVDSVVRLRNGSMDIRPRPHWGKWRATVRIRYDSEQFKAEDVGNLLLRAGIQNGIGCGRHNSKDSYGMGWGCLRARS